MALPPEVSVTFALDPISFLPGEAVELSITVVSHAPTPITIFTWPTIFNIRLALKRKNFECTDLDTNTPLNLETTKGGKRRGFSRTRGNTDEQYYHTLMPGEPLRFTSSFTVANRGDLIPGHRYRFEVNRGEQVGWWRAGTKEEVLAPPGEAAGLDQNGDEPIQISLIADVEFVVKGIGT